MIICCFDPLSPKDPFLYNEPHTQLEILPELLDCGKKEVFKATEINVELDTYWHYQ